MNTNLAINKAQRTFKEHFLLIKSLICILIIISIVQQFSFFQSYYSTIRNAIYIIGLLTIILSVSNFSKIKSDTFTRFFLAFFLSFQLLSLMGVLYGNSFNNIGTLYIPISISFFIYMISSTIYSKSNSKTYIILMVIYVVLMLMLTFDIFKTYFNGIFISAQYLYDQKNSKGPMIDFSILFTIFLILNLKNKILKFFLSSSIIFEFLVLNLMRSRADLLALYIVLIIFVLKSIRKRLLLALIIIITSILLFIIFLPNLVNSISSTLIEVFIKNYNVNNLNSLSAGRLYYYNQALKIFETNPIMGTLGLQNYYVDNAFLTLIANYGLIGMILYVPFIGFLFYKIFANLLKESIKELRFYISLAWLVTLIISLFEGLPPFGPGTTYLIVWILLPLITSKVEKKKVNI